MITEKLCKKCVVIYLDIMRENARKGGIRSAKLAKQRKKLALLELDK